MWLELDNLTLRAGDFRLGPLSLGVAAGEYLVLLGPSGAGKTLTLEAIAGLRRLLAGRVIIDGREVSALAPETRHTGFLYQDSLLFPHLGVYANVAYGARRTPRHGRREGSAAASAGASRWPAHWRQAQAFSCSTNR